MVDRILESTLAYVEHKKNEMSASYSNFMKQPFTKAELFCYLGALMLLGLHEVKITGMHGVQKTLKRLSG